MAKVKIEDSTGSFEVSLIGSQTKESFMGAFSVKCFLSPMDVIKADRLYRELLGEVSPHLAATDTQNLCFALSQLKYRVISSPAGWKNKEIDGGHLDANIVIEVLNKSIECQTVYMGKSKKRLETLQKELTKEIKSGNLKETDELEGEDE